MWEKKKLDNLKIKILLPQDAEYPRLLKEIYDPPWLLYRQGQPLPTDHLNIAIVGTRQCSIYGRQVTHQIVKTLANSPVTIISGLALGIDTTAHEAALKNNCFTIVPAIFPCRDTICHRLHNARFQKI